MAAGCKIMVEQSLPIQRFTTPEVVASAGQVQDTTVETIARRRRTLPQATRRHDHARKASWIWS